MGIQGLLPLLSPIHVSIELSKLAGKRVGVDAFVWLHRGSIGCALELVLDKPLKHASYVSYCLKQARELSRHGIIPVLVFDGGSLPSKGSAFLLIASIHK